VWEVWEEGAIGRLQNNKSYTYSGMTLFFKPAMLINFYDR
jgi:hypothetical protein